MVGMNQDEEAGKYLREEEEIEEEPALTEWSSVEGLIALHRSHLSLLLRRGFRCSYGIRELA